jgi:hypothetical protein
MSPRSRILVLALVSAVACNSQKDSPQGNDSTSGAGSADQAAAKVDDKIAKEVDKALSDEARFGKDMRKKACELLSPKMVADTFGVPEGELEQRKIMGCIYTWKGGGEIVEARITMLRAHKSEKMAATWFGNATKSLTKEEMAAQMQMVKKRVKERKEVDTKLKKDTADKLADVASDMMPDGGVSYEDLAGVGDQARVNTNDGSVWVRVANLTFHVVGFKGKDMEQPKYTAADMKNIKKVTAMAKKAQQEWLKATIDQRRGDGTKLAKLIVGKL